MQDLDPSNKFELIKNPSEVYCTGCVCEEGEGTSQCKQLGECTTDDSFNMIWVVKLDKPEGGVS
jgi:hypothetical protein